MRHPTRALRFAAPALLLVLALVGCQPAPDTLERVMAVDAPAPPSKPTSTTTTAPPPPPDHCADYEAMERGEGHPVNQAWFNQLAARHDDKGYARLVLACVYGGGADQWAALDELWRLENDGDDPSDGNDWHETNVPQAKPRSKMGCVTWDHRCQDRWGLRYIAERYGTPVAALRAWWSRSPHWY